MKKKTELSHFFKNFKKTLHYMKDDKLKLMIYIFLYIIIAILGILGPIYGSKLIVHITQKELEQFIYTSIIISVLSFSHTFMNFLQSLIFQKIHKNILIKMQLEIAQETLKLQVQEVDKNTTGLFINRLTRDASKLSEFFIEYIKIISDLISDLGIIVTIFILSKEVFVFQLICGILISCLNKIKIKKSLKIRKEYEKLDDSKTSILVESVRGIRDIKVLNSLKYIKEKIYSQIFSSIDKFNKLKQVNHIYTFIIGVIRTIINLLLALLIVALYKKSMITIPSIILVYNYRWTVFILFTRLNSFFEYSANFVLTSDKVFEVIENKKFKKEIFGNKKIKHLEGNIKFENVWFEYTDSRPILKDISFDIKANQKIGFVGKSGAGKTTIFNLITKLYNRTSGNILLDRYNIDELDQNSLRDNMSIITQSPYIFNFSIKDNLLLAKPDSTMEELKKACEVACIDEYIMSLPNKYDTIVGENGVILSGGQKQRLAIARALLMKTKIILFDEATSALDNETQDEIQKAIQNLKGEYTILIIAHRLSTVIDSDKIFIIDEGKVLDSGTHQELLEHSEFYNSLYEKDLQI